jgi:hypothetical protein
MVDSRAAARKSSKSFSSKSFSLPRHESQYDGAGLGTTMMYFEGNGIDGIMFA